MDQSIVVIDSSDNNDDNDNYVGGRVGGGSDSSATSTGASVSVPPSSEDQASLAIGRSLKEQLRTTENELYDLEDQLAELQSRVASLQSHRDGLRAKLHKHEAEDEARRNRKDWSKPSTFSRSDEIAQALRTLVAPTAVFRANQREVINATLSGRDTFTIMPTGGGKSLCFLIPAMVAKGLTVIISPLLALMQDQIMEASKHGINAKQLNGSTPREEATLLLRQIGTADCPVTMLYVTPEKMAGSKRLLGRLEKAHECRNLKRFVIDEAHCCSEWGHDFRPDYQKLNLLKIQFKEVPIMVLTATATLTIQQDVRKILGMPGCEMFRSSSHRPNLQYQLGVGGARSDVDSTETTTGYKCHAYNMIESFLRTDSEKYHLRLDTTKTHKSVSLAKEDKVGRCVLCCEFCNKNKCKAASESNTTNATKKFSRMGRKSRKYCITCRVILCKYCHDIFHKTGPLSLPACSQFLDLATGRATRSDIQAAERQSLTTSRTRSTPPSARTTQSTQTTPTSAGTTGSRNRARTSGAMSEDRTSPAQSSAGSTVMTTGARTRAAERVNISSSAQQPRQKKARRTRDPTGLP